jgi:hypothetical protein
LLVVPPGGPSDPWTSLVDTVLSVTATEAAKVVRPEVAAAVASTFGFPIGLALVVVAFLVLQNRLDNRDPKLRAAAASWTERTLPYEREDEL